MESNPSLEENTRRWTAYLLPRKPTPPPRGVKGSLYRARHAHMNIANSWVLNIITRGVGMLFGGRARPPRNIRFLPPYRLATDQNLVIDQWILDAKAKGFISEASHVKMTHPIFAVPKATGGWRIVIDLRRLNRYLKKPHFKLPNIKEAGTLAHKEGFCTKIDLTDAFHHIDYNNQARAWTAFSWKGTTYTYNVMAFGNSTSPWILTRVLAPAIRQLRLQGISLIVYIDDILILSPNRSQCERDTRQAVRLLSSLGWTINLAKSVLVPTQRIEFLGIILDTQNEPHLDISPTKRKKISHEVSRMSRAPNTRLRFLARTLGLISSLTAVMPQLRSFSRRTMIILQQAVTQRRNWNAVLTLPRKVQKDLKRIGELIRSAPPRPIDPKIDLEVRTDASLTGIGAVLIEPTQNVHAEVIRALSLKVKQQKHINVLELTSVLKALRTWAPLLRNKTVRLKTDNRVALSYLLNHSGRINCLQKTAKRITKICLANKILLVPQYITSANNAMADHRSRLFQRPNLLPAVARLLNLQGPTAFPFPNTLSIAKEIGTMRLLQGTILTPIWKTAAWWPMMIREATEVVKVPAPLTAVNPLALAASSGYMALWNLSSNKFCRSSPMFAD